MFRKFYPITHQLSLYPYILNFWTKIPSYKSAIFLNLPFLLHSRFKSSGNTCFITVNRNSFRKSFDSHFTYRNAFSKCFGFSSPKLFTKAFWFSNFALELFTRVLWFFIIFTGSLLKSVLDV